MDNELPKSEMQDILEACYKSTKVFASVFFEERFYASFSKLHDEIFDLIDSGAPRIAIAAPRGIGKSSIVGLALTAKRILFQDSHFIPYVSTSFAAACLQTENLKRELITNVLVRKLFGNLKTGSAKLEGIDESFSKQAWVAKVGDDRFGTLILPRGSGQQIRGVLYANFRPDLFIVDDLEDPETIENEDIRKKRRQWFNADLLKAVSRIDKNWQIVYIDTVKHEDSLLEDLLASPDWESVRQEICDDNLKSNAPEFISDEEVVREHAYYKAEGLLDVFYRENRNIPISKEDAVFKQEYFRSYIDYVDHVEIKNTKSNEIERISSKDLLNVTLVDPAKTVKMSSADSAVGTIGVDRRSRRILVRQVTAEKFEPDQLYNEMFEQVRRFNSFILGVEVTSLERFVSQPIENEMRVKGIFPIYVAMKASGKKEERVGKLSPLYKLGYVYHNHVSCDILEGQLLMFPRSKRWDAMDMLAYIIYIMDDHAVYFDPIGMGDEDSEEEYSQLFEEDEKPLEVEGII